MNRTTGSAGLDRMIANGFRLSSDATLSKKDDVASLSRVNVGQTLSIDDVTDPNAKTRAVAASEGGTLSIAGEVSDKADSLNASLFYAETAGSTLSDAEIADAAIGAANRAAIRKETLESNLRQDQIRERIEAETRQRLDSVQAENAIEVTAETVETE